MKVSLFPFLPVLLCMMGAMIMLLVLVAWNVQEQAVNPLEIAAQTLTIEEANELRETIVMKAEEADWFTENFVIARQNAEEELAEYQAKLALAEKETQKIRDELVRLEQLARQLDSQESATPEEVEQLKRLLAQQQQRKATAELELAELQKNAAQKEKSYAIVPSRSANGTFRRPIYIECRNDKIIIQPEGVELVPGDFQLLDRPDNPFATVLRVIRQYYIDTEQIVRGSEPYPLMLVRPSGVEIYESALRAFAPRKGTTGDWIKDFGYEIVNEDWNIQYPEPNEELRNRILHQLEIARNRLSGYLVAMRMAESAPGYGSNVPGGNRSGGGRTGGNVPQNFRMDHHGNVMPTGNGMRSDEDFQRQLAANRQGQQTGGQEGNTLPKGTTPHGAVADGTTEANRMNAPTQNTARKGPEQMAGQNQEIGEQQQSAMQRPPQNSSLPRQQNWGLQGITQYTTGISRTVRIRCEAGRFVLVPQAGLAVEKETPITGSVASAADQLVQSIWEFQQSWGSAGTNGHWKPILKTQVAPGGEHRLSELKALLKTSGLMIEE
jgi:hypothetical protein